jgi:hypothetical protein
MKKYKVLRDCHGFQRRHWLKGAIVEFDDDLKPPHHFLLIKGDEPKPVEDKSAPRPVVYSTLASLNSPAIKTGMAANLAKPQNPIVGRKKTGKK